MSSGSGNQTTRNSKSGGGNRCLLFRLGEVEAGVLVDIRTLDYVWCKGVIISTSYKASEKRLMVLNVRYEKDRRCEEIREDSARLAPYGFYTNRTDLPRY